MCLQSLLPWLADQIAWLPRTGVKPPMSLQHHFPSSLVFWEAITEGLQHLSFGKWLQNALGPLVGIYRFAGRSFFSLLHPMCRFASFSFCTTLNNLLWVALTWLMHSSIYITHAASTHTHPNTQPLQNTSAQSLAVNDEPVLLDGLALRTCRKEPLIGKWRPKRCCSLHSTGIYWWTVCRSHRWRRWWLTMLHTQHWKPILNFCV